MLQSLSCVLLPALLVTACAGNVELLSNRAGREPPATLQEVQRELAEAYSPGSVFAATFRERTWDRDGTHYAGGTLWFSSDGRLRIVYSVNHYQGIEGPDRQIDIIRQWNGTTAVVVDVRRGEFLRTSRAHEWPWMVAFARPLVFLSSATLLTGSKTSIVMSTKVHTTDGPATLRIEFLRRSLRRINIVLNTEGRDLEMDLEIKGIEHAADRAWFSLDDDAVGGLRAADAIHLAEEPWLISKPM